MNWLSTVYCGFPLGRRMVFWGLLLIPAFVQAQEVSLKTATRPEDPTRALREYVQAADATFAWELLGNRPTVPGQGSVYELKLTSQTWQNIEWKHSLVIFEPAELRFPEHAILFVTGGKTAGSIRDGDFLVGTLLAQLSGARCAILLSVPNQPLMGDKVEDDLITETFLRYLDSGDPTWPLLFPMVKSAVRAMDAVQAFTTEKGTPVDKFIVTGASKRGWTSWLTGASDKRVVGIAPIVIDTLNFQKQMEHQIATWGKYSEQIDDYTRKGLVKVMQEQPEIPLWRWVDPYTYREQLTLPKLLINGTNDRYWVLDALNNYWNDLQGPKNILYVPNAGHSLKGGQHLALTTLAGFTRHLASGTPLPEFSWQHSQTDHVLKLQINGSDTIKSAKLWSTQSTSKDFRESRWSSTDMQANKQGFAGEIPRPESGHTALYGEVQFEIQDLIYSLTTQVHVE